MGQADRVAAATGALCVHSTHRLLGPFDITNLLHIAQEAGILPILCWVAL